ncbi:MAG TPA: apolipoprotein N-acyltransferase [Polyangiaceae bacterium]|nr:apolipoprotein N-acyltransferase [Polyangiaceae bacterium]
MVGPRVLWPLCLGLTLAAGCSDLTAPHEERVTALPEPPAPAARPAAEAASAQAPPPAPSPSPSPEVAHVLIAYKGAKNAPAKATRTKEQARKLAEDLAKRAAKEDFAALAKRTSDDAATAPKGGSLGALTASSAPKPLYDAAAALAPGAVSAVVETDAGFHILKRPAAPGSAPPTPAHAGSAKPPTTAPRPSAGPPVRPTIPPPPPRPTPPPPRPKAPGGSRLSLEPPRPNLGLDPAGAMTGSRPRGVSVGTNDETALAPEVTGLPRGAAPEVASPPRACAPEVASPPRAPAHEGARDRRALALQAAAALATGGLYAAAFGARPGTASLALLALVAYAPLFAALDGVRSPARTIALGWAAGAFACALGFAWLLAPMRGIGGLALPFALALYAPFVALEALRFAAHAGLALALRRWAASSPGVAFALAFALSERFTPAIIPWDFAAALVDLPPTLALAPWLGPVGAALGAVACNAALLELASHLRSRRGEAAAAPGAAPAHPCSPRHRAAGALRRAPAWLGLAGALASSGWLAPTRDIEAPLHRHDAAEAAPRRRDDAEAPLPWGDDAEAPPRSRPDAAAPPRSRPDAAAPPRSREGSEAARPLRVGVVQAPSVAGGGAVDPIFAWRRLLELHREARLRGATIVALGEGALPFELTAGELADGAGPLYGAAFGVPTLVGAVVRGASDAAAPEAEAPSRRAAAPEAEAPSRRAARAGETASHRAQAPTNSVLAFSSAGLVGRYDKATLLPFSEYLPFEERLPWLRALSPASGRFRPGRGGEPFRLAGRTLAPSICFEDLFARAGREAASAPGVEALFNATNDGWFGDTSEPWVHLAHARLRAAEAARPLIRAATTGPSALIDARGRVVALAEPFRDAVLVADLRPSPGAPTFYARWGDLAWVIALTAAALAAGKGASRSP